MHLPSPIHTHTHKKSFLPLCRWLSKSWVLHPLRGRICGRTPPSTGFLCRLGALWCTAAETGSPEPCNLAYRQIGNEVSGFLSPPDRHWRRWWWWRGRKSTHLSDKQRVKVRGSVRNKHSNGTCVGVKGQTETVLAFMIHNFILPHRRGEKRSQSINRIGHKNKGNENESLETHVKDKGLLMSSLHTVRCRRSGVSLNEASPQRREALLVKTQKSSDLQECDWPRKRTILRRRGLK